LTNFRVSWGSVERLMRYGDFSIFEGPFVKRLALCYQTVICPVCDVGVLWPNGWTDQDTRRPASADRTARRQFQATGQPVSRTQEWRNDVTGAALWREVCATQVLPMGVGPVAFRYQRNGATPCQYIDTTRKAIDCTTTLPLTVFT